MVAERLSYPERAVIVSCPARGATTARSRSSPATACSTLTGGPTKGGLRYDPSVDLGEVRGAGDVDDVEVRLMKLPFGGAKGGIASTRRRSRCGEKEKLTRRFTEGARAR